MSHIHREDYVVRSVPKDQRQLAFALVAREHYSKGAGKVAVFCFGLYQREGDDERLVGVATWLPPTAKCAQSVSAHFLQGDVSQHRRVITLSRLAIEAGQPTNAATYFLGQCERLIREDGRYLYGVTYADTRMGHAGTIYKASNWDYLGETRPNKAYIDPMSGRQVSVKAGAHTRSHAEMIERGFVCLGRFSKIKYVKDFYKGKRRRPPALIEHSICPSRCSQIPIETCGPPHRLHKREVLSGK